MRTFGGSNGRLGSRLRPTARLATAPANRKGPSRGDDFVNFCRVERRLAPLTCRAYERDVRACRVFLEAGGIHRWGAVRPPDLRRFLAAEAERRPAASSQSRTIAAVKGFFRFLVENEAIERDPASVLRTPKKSRALPDVLDQRELARLLRAVERGDVWEREHAGKRERDRLLLALPAALGAAHVQQAPLEVGSRPSCCAPARTCARSRSCSATSTSTRRSATRASPPTSCAAPVKRLRFPTAERRPDGRIAGS
jgi:hypothetical protein